MATEGDQILGGEHTMESTDDMTECTLETYVMLFTNVTQLNLIFTKEKKEC